MKSALSLLLIFNFTLFFSQDFEWGKLSQEEIDLKIVPFEQSADAVILKERGELVFTNDGYTLLLYRKIKILSENGYSFVDRKWSYNSSSRFDNVTVEKAHTLNFDGEISESIIEKKDIIINKTDNGITEVAVAFPNVKVGSVIEYLVQMKRPFILYAYPWDFQNTIPTISSSFKVRSVSDPNYKLILKGRRLTEKYANQKSKKEWELRNVPSYSKFNHVYNLYEYIEYIMFQMMNRYGYDDDYYKQKTWKGFKKLINRDIKNSIKKVDFQEIASKIESGENKLETLKNCVQYLRNNYKWDNYLAANTNNLKENFIKLKTGNAADFNIFLQGILKEKNIQSQLVINSLRSNGKIIIGYPIFSKLQTLVNIVTIDNDERVMIDAATSTTKEIKYLSTNYFNYIVLDLNSGEDNFIVVSPNLSEYISQQELEIINNSLKLNIRDQFKGYFQAESYEKQFVINAPIIKNSDPKIKEVNDWTVSYKNLILDNPNSSFVLIENPFTEKIKELKVDKDRDYPIELDFPYLKTIQLKIKIPDGYKLDTDNFQETISAFEGRLQYTQTVEYKENNEAFITWSLLINQIIFQPKEISAYIDFTNKFSNTISKIAVLKIK
ncbi:DUF3857 domain-containing protein [Chryseobacterium sp. KACC 21268]|nr:DUF3857 domain-containing protein [Chryseobacterium sp. KACC 21268]